MSHPAASSGLQPIDYYDVYYPPSKRLAPLTMKDICLAYEREQRMILDPEGHEILGGADGVLFVGVSSIADIAGVYSPEGTKIAGGGPTSFPGTPGGGPRASEGDSS